MRRLKPDEPAVRTGEGKCFRVSIHRVASGDMLERNPLVPAVPLLAAAKGTVLSSAAASQEIEDLHRSIRKRATSDSTRRLDGETARGLSTEPFSRRVTTRRAGFTVVALETARESTSLSLAQLVSIPAWSS
jgi:hypothetical protein